jgi:nitroreductase
MTALPGEIAEQMTAADLDRLLSNRWSCRAFLAKPVPDEIIERILAMAQKTASWNNLQPWQVLITRGQGTDRFRSALLDWAQDHEMAASHFPFPREYVGVYRERRRACGFQLYDAVGIQRGDKAAYARQTMRNFMLFDAPHVAIISSEEALGVYGAVDCGAYVSNFLLAAASLGVATIPQGAIARYSERVRNHFGLPPNRLVLCGISFGYVDLDDPSNKYRVDRAKLDEVVHYVNE